VQWDNTQLKIKLKYT